MARVLLLTNGGQQNPKDLCGGKALWTEVVTDLEDVCAAIGAGRHEVLLVRLPFANWVPDALILELQRRGVTEPIVMWAQDLATSEAVRLGKLGAFQVITDQDKPTAIATYLDEAGQFQRNRSQTIQQSSDESASEPWRRLLVGDSWAMRVVTHLVRLVSPRRCTVLITGETGTGKEMLARAIHEASPRAAMPMVALNCGALPEELLEAELFGHVKGAYTGAVSNRIGRLEQAHRGTLFLDEVGEMPMSLQVKLLRVLQEREFQRLGSSDTVKVDVRIIAATNADLAGLVRAGKFREDLFYRLNVAPVQLPPLRNRREDVPQLVNHFIRKICRFEGISEKSISNELLEWLGSFPWPGNVRQLENTVEMAVALSGNRPMLQMADFSSLITGQAGSPGIFVVPDDGLDYNQVVDQFERSILERALQLTQGSKKRAAELLKLKRTTFAAKLRSLNVALEACEDEDLEEMSLTA